MFCQDKISSGGKVNPSGTNTKKKGGKDKGQKKPRALRVRPINQTQGRVGQRATSTHWNSRCGERTRIKETDTLLQVYRWRNADNTPTSLIHETLEIFRYLYGRFN